MPKPSISNTLLAGRPARATHDAAADSFGRIAVFESLEALEGLQADAPPGHTGQPHADGRHAQTADLDQQDDYKLPKIGPISSGIMQYQPRYADS